VDIEKTRVILLLCLGKFHWFFLLIIFRSILVSPGVIFCRALLQDGVQLSAQLASLQLITLQNLKLKNLFVLRQKNLKWKLVVFSTHKNARRSSKVLIKVSRKSWIFHPVYLLHISKWNHGKSLSILNS
jgi:hypothetical protein